MTRRTERVNDLLEEEISDLLRRDVQDPRISEGLVSVTEVEVSADLHHAKVFVSILGGEAEQGEALKALVAAAPFLHRQLRKRLALKYIPALDFIRDDSLERGAHILDLLRETHANEGR
jgi:ribosome-binding factor A